MTPRRAAKKIKITELQRTAPIMEYFSASLSVLELVNKFKNLYHEIEKNFNFITAKILQLD